MVNTTPLEADEQKILVQWLELKKIKFTCIPNSTYTTSWKQRKNNKAMGLHKGLPDLLIYIETSLGGRLAFVELKRRKGGIISKEQERWISDLNNIIGVYARVCFGAEDAINFISSLL